MDYLYIAISVLLNSVAQVIQKKIAHKNKDSKSFSVSLLKSKIFYFIIFLYSLATLFWSIAVKTIPLSYAAPITSFSIVIVALLSKIVLREEIPKTRLIGIAIILFGIVLISV